MLCSVKLADSKAIFEYRSDKKTNQYQGFITDNVTEVEDFISRLSTEIKVSGTWFQLAIILKSNNKIIGDLGSHFIQDQKDAVELSCTISKSFQDKGFATEALTAKKAFLFGELGKRKLIASVDP